ADLPQDYVAARFYFSDCFPDTPSNRAFVASTLDALAKHTSVVLLDAPFAVDDHRDFSSVQAAAASPAGSELKVGLAGGRLPPRGAAREGGLVISIAGRMTPETNLAVQTAAIARARAFVGTYGGYSYLAPLHGVPSIAF